MSNQNVKTVKLIFFKSLVLQKRCRASWRTVTRAYSQVQTTALRPLDKSNRARSGRRQVVPNTNRRWERISEKRQTPQESTGTRLVCKQKKHTSTIQTEQGHRKQADCQARAEHAMKERKQIQPPAIPQDTETSVDTRTNTSETQDKIETARRASAPTQQSGRVVKTPTCKTVKHE